MKKEDLIIFIIGLLLLAGMLFTIFFGGEESRHGVGSLHDIIPGISFAGGATLSSYTHVLDYLCLTGFLFL